MAATTKVWTRAELAALQDAATDGVRYELIDGELLVSPSPNDPHQRLVSALLYALAGYCRHHRVGWAMTSPADLALDGESVLQPDVFVIPWTTRPALHGWAHVRELLLALNVLSPSTARGDRTVKRRFLQRVGVPEYWVVDYHARLVERWRPGDERPEILADVLTWAPVAGVEPLRVELAALFDEAVGGLTIED